ncbi:DUF1289 domain-containing protein [Variovorax sp. J22G73]|uniref:DUF1289 domain-containing protein n=1 Tax=unclassified Variovorax TaxID=663243 RepID=UPI000D5E2833|nr:MULTISPECIES: DUF1289 domain-containing protein [unclassified Variovorax]MDM0006832.1 DUF1289 domain-containing protein [Variovorax sp. J22R203]MDM0099416.1 DUF1289 domain-containing protein [Variovorax sp. J22G73]
MNFSDAETLAERAVTVQAATDNAPSPCTSVCRMDRLSGFCEGCLRTIPEIAGWSKMEDDMRRHVWRAIELRARAGIWRVPEADSHAGTGDSTA